MSYSMYQDPMQSQPMVIPNTGIGLTMMPKEFSFNDPVLLRHVLCAATILRNFFHICLCWRQLRLCSVTVAPPPDLAGLLSQEAYHATKVDEMFAVEQLLLSYVFDGIFSCIELYFCVYSHLWKLVIDCYSIVDDLIWQSIAFTGLFSTYMVLRRLPQIFYSKLVLGYWYEIDHGKSLPLVGVLCACSLVIVLLQVVLIPLTAIFLFIESTGGQFFALWIWFLVFVVSSSGLIMFTTMPIPLIGKPTKLPDGELKTALMGIFNIFGFPDDCAYIMKSNLLTRKAYASGLFCRKRVYIFETILFNRGKPADVLFPDEIGKGLNDKEMVAYVAHELAHWRNSYRGWAFCLFHVTLFIYCLIFGIVYRQSVIYESVGFSPGFYPPILCYWLNYKFVMIAYLTIARWFIFFFLRRVEFASDKYVHELGYGNLLISALLKLYLDRPTFPLIDSSYQNWHGAKPTTLQRVHRLKKLDGQGQRLPVAVN